ncbi:unnamed protein product [Coffea canephora]|uniref:Uncharacterized protein n=1 Tax=Coffea canephora TaxID=49390 RepID=A0A068UM80_COFCA|nr:unnamed protein product [Coffea canephora]
MGKWNPIPVIPNTALEVKEKLYVRRFSLMHFNKSLLQVIKEQPIVGLVEGYPSFDNYKRRYKFTRGLLLLNS